MNKEEIKLSSKIENNGNEISLITIAFYQGKEYDLQDLLNNLLNELQRKDNIINELKEELEFELQFQKGGCYNRIKNLLDKINELEGDNK